MTGILNKTSGDDPNSCAGELCKCDLDFAMKLSAVTDQWDKAHSSAFGFDRTKACAPKKLAKKLKASEFGDVGEADKRCCGRALNSLLYNASRMDCCKDGSIRSIGTCAL